MALATVNGSGWAGTVGATLSVAPGVAAAFSSCGPALAGLAQEHSTADRGAHSAETSDEGIRCRASGVDVVYEQHLAST